MSYPISEQLISYNRSYQALSPQGFVIHSTATPNATAQNEHDYFNGGDRQASSHYFVDGSNIIRCIPESEQAWHAGQTANGKYLSVEICEVEPFAEVWNRTVWLVADACVRYGWSTGPSVWSHRGISDLYKETDHTDPIAYLRRNEKIWNQLLAAIDAEIINLKKPVVIKVATVEADHDIYLSVRCYQSKADQAILDINKLGFAAKRMDLA